METTIILLHGIAFGFLIGFRFTMWLTKEN